jgi:dihydrolipoamide dehydrogenase
VREVERTVKTLGIDVRTGSVASKLDDDGLVVSSADATGHLPAERVLVAIGRRPNTDDLQLGEAGLEPDDTGHLPVDEQRRTAVRHVFAVGDVTTGRYFAHKAMAEGRVAAEAIAGQPVAFDQVVPMIAFTDPELASVGLSEDPGTVVGRARFASSGRAATLGERRGVVKVVADEQTETVLGVHIAGPGATDLAGEAALAVESAATLTDLAETVHPHPTLVEIIGDAARAARRG